MKQPKLSFISSPLFTQLNKKQQQAVLANKKHLMIVAGPGTGKTKTITAKLLHLLFEEKISSNKIIALTFTNKAAQEMKQRVKSAFKQLNNQSKLPFIGTFHALALKILKNKQQNIELISELDKQALAKEILNQHQAKITTKDFLLNLSKWKNLALNSVQLSKNIINLFKIYQQRLAKLDLLDFDDLIIKANTLINQSVKFEYILLDEYQDINRLQYQFIKALLSTSGKLIIIGDPNQAIYAFRGAAGDIFSKLKKDFSPKEIFLTKNYRNGINILQLAQSFLKSKQKLQAQSKNFGLAQVVETFNEFSEADFIVHQIEQLTGGVDMLQASEHHTAKQGAKFSDFAVIYRTHHLSRIIQQKMEDSGIPFQVTGEDSFLNSKQVSLLVNCLKVLAARTNDKVSFDDAKIKAMIDQFGKDFLFLSLSALIQKLIDLFSFEEKLKQNTAKLKQIYQFKTLVLPFEKLANPLPAFLNYLEELANNNFYDDKVDKVSLMTMHAAKGLEFDHVFICAFEEGHIPLSRKNQLINLAEEKRLLYVSLTRAKQSLYLLYTQKRHKQKTKVSVFINNFDKKFFTQIKDPALKKLEIKFAKKRQQKAQLGLFG